MHGEAPATGFGYLLVGDIAAAALPIPGADVGIAIAQVAVLPCAAGRPLAGRSLTGGRVRLREER
jgi:hypothetical protein